MLFFISDNFGLFDVPSRQSLHRRLYEQLYTVGWTTVTVPWLDCLDMPTNDFRRLLRSAARLCLRLPSFASVSDAMRRDLHWLNFPNRVTYKLCTMAYMCQHEMVPGVSPKILCADDDIMGRAQLRSASTRVLSVPRTRTVKFSRSGFYFAGPSAWNSLSVRLRQLPTFEAFKKDLKTYLFDL